MGTYGAKSNGMEEAPVTLEDSINGMLAKVCLSWTCLQILICCVD